MITAVKSIEKIHHAVSRQLAGHTGNVIRCVRCPETKMRVNEYSLIFPMNDTRPVERGYERPAGTIRRHNLGQGDSRFPEVPVPMAAGRLTRALSIIM